MNLYQCEIIIYIKKTVGDTIVEIHEDIDWQNIVATSQADAERQCEHLLNKQGFTEEDYYIQDVKLIPEWQRMQAMGQPGLFDSLPKVP